MASLSKDPSGLYTIQICGADGKRRSIRLGKVNKKTASEVKLKVEHLHSLIVSKLPMDSETAAWVAGIGDDLAAKLAAVGLVSVRDSDTLGQFLTGFIKRREADSKGATITAMGTVQNDLIGFFGSNVGLRDITESRADDFRTHLLTRLPKLAAATVSRRLRTVRLFFDFARRMKLIPVNPFADVSATSVLPAERQYYLTDADTAKLLAASNPTWRTVIALSRFAGLRNPSEVLSLKWEHVNFATGRMTVPSPKTEHHAGRAYRTVPIFARLRPYLDDAYDLAEQGEVYVIGGTTGVGYRAASDRPGGWMNANMRTTFLKIVRRAGLQAWPRLFHNLRASCETDLMQDHPIHAVCSWLGNTPTVALRHYLQVIDGDFNKAIEGRKLSGADSGAVALQNTVQSASGSKRPETTKATQPVVTAGLSRLMSCSDSESRNRGLGVTGLEPNFATHLPANTLRESSFSIGAESGAVAEELPELADKLANCSSLPEPIKAAIRALLATVEAARG